MAPERRRRGRRSAGLIGAGVALALGTVGVYGALRGGDHRAAGPDPAPTTVPTTVANTFVVDLSTGAEQLPSAAVTGAEELAAGAVTGAVVTLPLPVISLPLPGATVAVPAIGAPAPQTGAGLPVGQPPPDPGGDVRLDALAVGCSAGDMAACDDLFLAAGIDTAYAAYGDTCAGRQPALTGRLCVDTFAQVTPTTNG